MKVICFLFDPNIGGPTKRARLISEALIHHDIEVSFALPHTNGSAHLYLQEADFKVYNLGISKPSLPKNILAFSKFLIRFPIDLLIVVRFLKKHKPDVIHVNGAFDILPAIAGKIVGTRIVWHLNDMVFGEFLSKKLGLIVANFSDVVAVTSVPVIEHYNVGKASPILLPVPVKICSYSPSYLPIKTPIRLTMIGNWNPLKGQSDFIKIVEVLLSEQIAVEGVLVGRLLESQLSYWEPIIKRVKGTKVESCLKIEGFSDDIPSVLEASDILLIPSVSESGPMSCIEAMASATPVISYDVGDVKKMLDPNGGNPCGIVVPQGEVEQMILAIKDLIQSPEQYLQMSKCGPVRAAALYSVETAALETSKAYKKATV